MFKFLLRLLSRYAHPFEKKANKFFKSIKSSSSRSRVHKKLEQLMQQNLVVLNLWMEKKYKNYVYLKKRVRRQMYENVEVLKEEFLKYAEKHQTNKDALEKRIDALGLNYPVHDEAKLLHLAAIMAYLHPGPHYTYQKAANFGKLLKNPLKEKLVGDCNQIVTLYTFLYSLKFPIKELQIKILPGHVCLHFRGIDIEATSGRFKNYDDYEKILPITELLSTNILDVVDIEATTAQIKPRIILKRAQLAQKISSFRELVDRNLNIAYRNLGVTLMRQNEYDSAIFYFEKLRDPKLLQKAYHNAAIYFLKGKNFSKAKHYAKQTGHEQLMKSCYLGEYNALAKKVRHIKTIKQAKSYKATYKKMLKLAQMAENHKAEDYVRGILKKL